MLYGLQEAHSLPYNGIHMSYRWAHKSACIDYRFVGKYFLQQWREEKKREGHVEWIEIVTNVKCLTLSILATSFITISLTYISATIFYDVVPWWTKEWIFVRALLICGANHETYFASLTAVLHSFILIKINLN